jgi:competence protein ComEA
MSTAFPDRRARAAALLGFFSLVLAGATRSYASDLEDFAGCAYVSSHWADGDSFAVRLPDGGEIVARLYFVDCVEKDVADVTGKRRLREQARHFGADDLIAVHRQGVEAAAFVAETLSRPFVVHTSFARAPGRSAKTRHYVFITTSEGRDLGELLVERGFARAFGFGRERPDGTRRDDWDAHLKDVELAAALERRGVWAHCDPGRLVAMRREQREELRALDAIDDALAPHPPAEPVDVNSANLEDLTRTGLRESLADEVIKNRPFASIEDLLRVRGIGPVTLERVRPHLRVEPATPDQSAP